MKNDERIRRLDAANGDPRLIAEVRDELTADLFAALELRMFQHESLLQEAISAIATLQVSVQRLATIVEKRDIRTTGT